MLPNFAEPVIYHEDLINAMCNYRRFNGHVDYTIMEHTMNVIARLPEKLRVYGLLHDAHEVYTWDMVRPLTHLVSKQAKEFEEKTKQQIYDTFSISKPTEEQLAVIKIADDEINILETEAFMHVDYLHFVLYKEKNPETRRKILTHVFHSLITEM